MATIRDVLRHFLEHTPATPAEHADLAAAIDDAYPPPEPEPEPQPEPGPEDKDAEIVRLKAELAARDHVEPAPPLPPPPG